MWVNYERKSSDNQLVGVEQAKEDIIIMIIKMSVL